MVPCDGLKAQAWSCPSPAGFPAAQPASQGLTPALLCMLIPTGPVSKPLLTQMPLLGLMASRALLPFQGWVQGFPGGAVVKNPPANAVDTGSIPVPGRSHMLRSN